MSRESGQWRQLLGASVLSPKEELLATRKQQECLVIGLPRERSLQEHRLCLTPSSVALLTEAGHQIWIERSAGKAAKYEDQAYQQAGAKLIRSLEEVLKAEIVLKVEPPTQEEIKYMQSSSTLISALQLGYQNSTYIRALNKKKITALAFEFLQDERGLHAIQRAMSEIAGSMVLFIAAEYLSTNSGGMGMVLGGCPGLPPSRIVLLGSGTVAESVARVALGLGADIHIFDSSIHRLRRLRKALRQNVFTSVMGYDILDQSLRQADVLIGAMRPNPAHKRCFVTEEMVQNMKKDAVIIDVSIDQGGCIDTSECTTHTSPIFCKHGVIHYCVPNITSRVARTATMALSNILTPLLLDVGKASGLYSLLQQRRNLLSAVYTYRGYLTQISIAKRFNIDYKDINLLVF